MVGDLNGSLVLAEGTWKTPWCRDFLFVWWWQGFPWCQVFVSGVSLVCGFSGFPLASLGVLFGIKRDG